MAASLKIAFGVLTQNFSLRNSLFRKSLEVHKAATQFDTQRFRRRRKYEPHYKIPKKGKGYGYQSAELTPANKDFLREIVEDKYEESPLKEPPLVRNTWNTRTLRCGVIAIKLGSYPLWYKNGKKVTCILFQVVDNHVIKYENPEVYASSRGPEKSHYKHKYGAVTLGALSTDPYQFNERYNELFADAGVPPKRRMTRMIVTENAALQPGTPLNAMHFKVGQYIDVRARTIGHGFQGVMKRWGFSGGPGSHGASKFHRRPGTIGSGLKKRVIKGQKMPGRMGFKWRYQKGLQILRINTKYNVIFTSGAVCPGPNHAYCILHDSNLPYHRTQIANDMRESPDAEPYMPTYLPHLDGQEPIPEEINHPDLFDFESDSIAYEVKAEKAKGKS